MLQPTMVDPVRAIFLCIANECSDEEGCGLHQTSRDFKTVLISPWMSLHYSRAQSMMIIPHPCPCPYDISQLQMSFSSQELK